MGVIRTVKHFGNACGFKKDAIFLLGPDYDSRGIASNLAGTTILQTCYVRASSTREYIGYIEKPEGNFSDGTPFRVIEPDIAAGRGYFKMEILSEYTESYVTPSVNNPSGIVYTDVTLTKKRNKNMVGNVYIAIVVQTKEVAAGEGLTTSVSISEVVHTTEAFVAADDNAARATALAEASEKHDIDINDRVKPIEVKLIKGV